MVLHKKICDEEFPSPHPSHPAYWQLLLPYVVYLSRNSQYEDKATPYRKEGIDREIELVWCDQDNHFGRRLQL